MRIRYAVTRLNALGMRSLAFGSDEDDFFDHRGVADKYLENIFKFSAPTSTNFKDGTYRIDAIQCYDNGTPMSVFVHDTEAPFDSMLINESPEIINKLRNELIRSMNCEK